MTTHTKEAEMEVTQALDSDEPKIGQVQWHCSEADGGPDVGILLGLSEGKMLWVGEMLDVDGIGAMGMKVYQGNEIPPALPFDYDGVREVVEEHIAPVIRGQAQALATARAEIAAKDAEIAQLQDEVVAAAYSAANYRADIMLIRLCLELGETQEALDRCKAAIAGEPYDDQALAQGSQT